MNTTILKKIGLTEGEIRVYLALLELGSSSTGPIIDKSHITGSKIYVILERLEQKGLVSHIIKNNVKHFQVASPHRLLDYMEEKMKYLQQDTEQLKEMIPQLEEKMHLQETQETNMYQGIRGFQTAINEFMRGLHRGDEYVVLGGQGSLDKKYISSIKKTHMYNETKGIKTRLIYNKRFYEVKRVYKKFKLSNIKFIDHITPSSVAISKEKVLIMNYGDNPIQVVIKSSAIAESFRQFFETMWQVAKP
ncbi:MAG: helix-turn-helix domain-containing protein [Candidatus Woesearchaeota archaeon]|nr:helix-turn-helix domain-containing protein [Candidatus Woesearchaeota archaeon]